MNTKYFLFAVLCGLCFSVGVFVEPSAVGAPTHERVVSSQREVPAPASPLDYATIPCPSAEEMATYIKDAHIVGVAENPTCDGSKTEKILKLFKLAALLKAAIPKNWAGSADNIINDPYAFITKTTPKLNMAHATDHAIASNQNGQEIFLGHEFFEIPPLKALEVLIHENHHSNPDGSGHVICLTGDVMKTAGACDALFTRESYLGSYSVGVLFSLAYSLYAINLSKPARQQLMNSAIAVLSTRFNAIPNTLAVPLDMVYTLDAAGQVALLHPYTFESIPVVLPVDTNEKIVRIQYNPINSGVLAISDRGRMYTADQWGESSIYYEGVLPRERRFVDSNKMFTPSASYSYTYFVEDSGDIYFKDTDSSTGVDELHVFRKNLPYVTQRVFTSYGSTMTALSETGNFFYFASSGPAALYPQELKNTQLENVQWKDGSGGVTYDVLYAVGSDGLVYFGDDSPHLQVPLEPSAFVSDEPFEKFQEGLNLKIALSSAGNLYAWDHAHSTAKPWQIPTSAVVDFAIGRKYLPQTSLQPLQLSRTAKNRCAFKLAYLDPWSGKQMGVDTQARLVFTSAEDDGKCIVYGRNISGDTLQMGTQLLTKTNTYFDRTYLNFIRGPKNQPLFPYADLNN